MSTRTAQAVEAARAVQARIAARIKNKIKARVLARKQRAEAKAKEKARKAAKKAGVEYVEEQQDPFPNASFEIIEAGKKQRFERIVLRSTCLMDHLCDGEAGGLCCVASGGWCAGLGAWG